MLSDLIHPPNKRSEILPLPTNQHFTIIKSLFKHFFLLKKYNKIPICFKTTHRNFIYKIVTILIKKKKNRNKRGKLIRKINTKK